MCTKIQDFACKIPKFFRGLYPRTRSAGGGDPLPHPPPAWLRHARRRSAPRLRGPRPPLVLQHPPNSKSCIIPCTVAFSHHMKRTVTTPSQRQQCRINYANFAEAAMPQDGPNFRASRQKQQKPFPVSTATGTTLVPSQTSTSPKHPFISHFAFRLCIRTP
jgi:hypothetical protein